MSQVAIYTKHGCPYCAAAKEDYTKRGVAFTEKNVEESKAALAEMVKLSGGRRVPVIVEDGQVSVGFGGS